MYTSFLRDNGHLSDALDAEEIEASGKNKLVHNIVISYLCGDEELDDEEGLLNWLIGRWRFDELREVIWLMWTLRKGQQDETNAKALALWAVLDDRANSEVETDRRILSHLCSLSVFVDELNEQATELIIRGAPFAEIEHDSYILLEELRRLVDDYPKQVGIIFLAMLENFAPTYQQEDIEYILRKLYDSGGESRQKANSIFELYLGHGVEFPALLRAEMVQ